MDARERALMRLRLGKASTPVADWLSGGLLTRVKAGSIPARCTNSHKLRYASGEAARLSIGREGFDLPTERQFSRIPPRSSEDRAPRFDRGYCAGSTPAGVANQRKVVRGGTQPVSKTGPTSGSRVRLLRLPPGFAFLSCCRLVTPVSMKQGRSADERFESSGTHQILRM